MNYSFYTYTRKYKSEKVADTISTKKVKNKAM